MGDYQRNPGCINMPTALDNKAKALLHEKEIALSKALIARLMPFEKWVVLKKNYLQSKRYNPSWIDTLSPYSEMLSYQAALFRETPETAYEMDLKRFVGCADIHFQNAAKVEKKLSWMEAFLKMGAAHRDVMFPEGLIPSPEKAEALKQAMGEI